MNISTSDTQQIKSILAKLKLPAANSHKGQNGRALIVGGSHLFHAASIWAAELASHFVDMLHYSSTVENAEIITSLKKMFRNGIIVPQQEIPFYVKEDDAILLGPGMVRGEIKNEELRITNFEELLTIKNEASYTRELTKFLLRSYPEKRFIIDAGALQMMEVEWLKELREKPVITPHQLEFEHLFKTEIKEKSLEEKTEIAKKKASEYRSVILLKAITDIVTDGNDVYMIQGGNQGLTKGGTGDILAGLTMSLRVSNDAVLSAMAASIILKRTADELFEAKGYWYNVADLIENIPHIFKKLLYN